MIGFVDSVLDIVTGGQYSIERKQQEEEENRAKQEKQRTKVATDNAETQQTESKTVK